MATVIIKNEERAFLPKPKIKSNTYTATAKATPKA